MRLRGAITRALNPIVWGVPGREARKFFGFALAEQGSMIDLAAAARLTPSPERRAAYVRHLLDESRHARVFTLRSAELRAAEGRASFGWPHADTEDLFANLGEVRFLAFVHRGEARGCEQFTAYRDWFARRGDHKTSAMFEAILRDERRHMRYTRELLVDMTGSERAAGRAVRRAMLWEAGRTWRRGGRAVAERLYVVLMLAFSLLLAPFALVVRLTRPVRAGWVPARRQALRSPFRRER
jgi:hypothetical protein